MDNSLFFGNLCATLPCMKTYAYIDASNMFYGGKKSLGWSVDYKKLRKYLEEKYQVSQVYFFGGVEIHKFPFDYLKSDTVPIHELEEYLADLIKEKDDELPDITLTLLERHIKRVRFYIKIEKLGYNLVLKPVKTFYGPDGLPARKANCDVDMAYLLMRDKNKFERVLILSGDGDFLPVLKYLRSIKKEVLVLAHGHKTAKEIRQFAGDKFMDFTHGLRKLIERIDL